MQRKKAACLHSPITLFACVMHTRDMAIRWSLLPRCSWLPRSTRQNLGSLFGAIVSQFYGKFLFFFTKVNSFQNNHKYNQRVLGAIWTVYQKKWDKYENGSVIFGGTCFEKCNLQSKWSAILLCAVSSEQVYVRSKESFGTFCRLKFKLI